MLYTIAVALLVLWLLGVLLRFGGQLIYLALLAGVALIVVGLLGGRNRPG